MTIECKIHFQEETPAPEEILDKVKKITGLQFITLSETKDGFVHPLFDNNTWFVFNEGDCHITIFTNTETPEFLLKATSKAMEELGGLCYFNIPE